MAQVITVILLDGNPKGFRLVELANWAGKAFVVPRANLKALREREDTHQPGLYFLFGEKEGGERVYIGQSEDIAGRLLSHDTNREEDEWNTAFIFIGNLDSALIKHLESHSLETAKKAKRYEIFNSASPKGNYLSEAQKIIASEYFEKIRLITSLSGFNLFEEAPKENQAEEVYSFEDVKNKDASAKGTLLNSGEFVVFAGSKARIATTPSLEKHGRNIILLRGELLRTGVIDAVDSKSYLFKKDHLFSSPSMAATLVAGRSSNGWTAWKDEKGLTLDEVKRK